MSSIYTNQNGFANLMLCFLMQSLQDPKFISGNAGYKKIINTLVAKSIVGILRIWFLNLPYEDKINFNRLMMSLKPGNTCLINIKYDQTLELKPELKTKAPIKKVQVNNPKVKVKEPEKQKNIASLFNKYFKK
jgi:hypothetical protein